MSLTLKMTSTKFGDDGISKRHSEKNILDKIQDGRKYVIISRWKLT